MKKILVYVMLLAGLLAAATAHAQQRTIYAEWTYQTIADLAGFRLYRDGVLTCQVSDPAATSLTCDVDAPDGSTTFTLTAYFSDGTESDPSTPLSFIFSSTLAAQATASPAEGNAPLSVTFDGTASTGNIISYQWMFGDGSSATGSTATHHYPTAGNYNAILKVTESGGAVDQKNITIVVNQPTGGNTAPTAVISSSVSVGNAPLSVEFDGRGSTDSDGTIVSYSWDFGDGGTASGSLVSHTYTVAASYSAKLTVTDNGGLTDIITTPVLVQPPVSGNTPPTAVISASASGGNLPLTISFSGQNSSDPDGQVVAYSWNFGDGKTASGKSVSHTYTTAATYKVTLKVTDNGGAVSPQTTYTIIAGEQNTNNGASLLPILHLLLKNKEE